MVEHGTVDSGKVIQFDHMSLRHPKGHVSDCPQNLHDLLVNCPFSLCSEEWQVFTVGEILEPFTGEFL